MLKVALKTNYINDSDIKTLERWREDPATWVPEANNA
jgi:hypothetical protein